MKNLPTFLISATVMVCCMFLTCTKDTDLVPDPSASAGELKCAHPGGAEFIVSPSGNFTDDASAIQEALEDAVAAGPGSVVKLTKGTFYLNKGIEVEGFDGYFKGAGKAKTIITTNDLVEFDVQDYDLQALIKFRHGNINISDLTINISDPEPCHVDWTANALPCAIMITGNSSEDPGATDQPASSTFNNVKFEGGAGSFNGYNIVYSVFIVGEGDGPLYALNGGFRFTNCEFQTTYIGILSDLTKGPFTIGGTGTSGNKFNDAGIGCIVQDFKNSSVNISNNQFKKIWFNAIQIWQGTEWVDISTLSLSKFLVYGNDIEVYSDNPAKFWITNAIWLIDNSMWSGLGNKLLDANLSNNNIFMNNIDHAGIWGIGLQDAVIKNNKLWGSGVAGIVGGIWGDQSSGWVIKGNNVQGVTAEVAPIWLGPSTRNFLVYADKNDVLDEGTDNILIGANKKRCDHPSLEMKEKMMRQHDMMKMHKFQGRR